MEYKDWCLLSEEWLRKEFVWARLIHKENERGDITIVPLWMIKIYTGKNPRMFIDFKKAMTKKFEMTDWPDVLLLGVEVTQSDKGIFISQRKYVIQNIWEM